MLAISFTDASKWCLLLASSTCTLVVILGIAVCVTSSVLVQNKQSGAADPQLGHRGDTIELSILEPFCQSKVTVFVCDQPGDSPHINYLFLVKRDNITIHQLAVTFESTQIDQDFSSSTSGLVNYLYLIEGSIINYTICLGSLAADLEVFQGSLFVFNNGLKFSLYQDSPELGEQLSIFSKKFEIGKNNETKCLSMVYKAPKTSYYFVASRTPGGIFYTFNYSKHVLFYDHRDYKQLCSIYEGEPCELSVPGAPFSFEEYLLLAYVKPNVETTAIQNHICVSVEKSNGVVLISGICAPIGGLALIILILLIVIQVVACYRQKHRKGYMRIQNSPPSYDAIYHIVT